MRLSIFTMSNKLQKLNTVAGNFEGFNNKWENYSAVSAISIFNDK